ncbi:hypothetical protein [Collimonas arenae]|uniref:hypothetical protein n=1 Tax=Collimonas arenae TaxID=279058 RepID=UPI00069201AC|nr:hypothetical protein [Collimonas arenae]
MSSKVTESDSIPFEKVPLTEAKAILDGEDKAVRRDVPDWEFLRRPQAHKDQDLLESTYQWYAKLPADIKPWELARYFPRVTNELAAIWARPTMCEQFLDQLLLDNRGNRKGFPEKVIREIMVLQHYLHAQAGAAHAKPDDTPMR